MRQTLIDILLAMAMVAVIAALVAMADRLAPEGLRDEERGERRAAGAMRFAAVDVFVDPHNTLLAAYQVEITPRFVPGQECTFLSFSDGGTHPAYREVPYHDPAALNRAESHLILAAFSTAEELPTGRTRVVRIDVAYSGEALPVFSATPM